MLVMRAMGWSYVETEWERERSGDIMHLCFIRITGKGQAGVLLMLNSYIENRVLNKRRTEKLRRRQLDSATLQPLTGRTDCLSLCIWV